MDQARKQGVALPKAIRNAPILRVGLDFYYAAFWDLTNDRDEGMGEGGIPWTAIDRYAIRHDISDIDDFQRLVGLIKYMDIGYRKFRDKKQKDKIAKNKRANKPRTKT